MSKKIIIAGGGIGGLSAALALNLHGFEVHVLEQSDALAEVGAGIQLSPNAMHVLQMIGVSGDVLSHGFLPTNATMRHFRTAKEYLRMPLGDAIEKKFGAPYVHIHRADLHQVLHRAALSSGIHISVNARVKRYQNLAIQGVNQVQVYLDDGREMLADALIGADGIRSAVKKQMLPLASVEFTGQVAWRGTIDAQKVPRNLVKPEANLWIGPGAHLVSYYVRGGKEINVIAVQEQKQWTDTRWSVPGDVKTLRAAFVNWHSDVTQLLSKVEECFLWGLFASRPLDTWVDGHVALLGDACHPMLPFVAQGAAMAIEDSACLAQALSAHEKIDSGLSGYQSRRYARVTKVQRMAAKNASLYHMQGASSHAKLLALKAANTLSSDISALPMSYVYGYRV
ncbi:FAD-dependent monooxygenase [Paraglaciecola chathamensis]|uniref:FAD-dependent monooxygenase n=1 Tax=Paraglaciecola chathamensis TaxID=368405 RepID=UPI0026F87225|nr:FAD-dependent monooxygenase [Paraglaciecola chathamensis]MDO6559308.1 FAD-dependent monooxygenase [Paraglaciecola chathamensis]